MFFLIKNFNSFETNRHSMPVKLQNITDNDMVIAPASITDVLYKEASIDTSHYALLGFCHISWSKLKLI